MNKHQTVIIGGQAYDAITGLPVATTTGAAQTPASAPAPANPTPTQITQNRTPAAKLHKSAQRSATLNRKHIKRPVHSRMDITTHHAKTFPVHSNSVHTHPQVRKFAPHPVAAKVVTPAVDIAPVPHPSVEKAHRITVNKHAGHHSQAVPHVPAQQIKQTVISQAIKNTNKPKNAHKPRFWQTKQRVTGVVAATFAIVLLGGYFTYLNMPGLSVRVAAAQAGIDAEYPDYRPDGYALNGPVTFEDGRVSMNFKANASDAGFTVSQSESGWDSDAVLDNYVAPRAGSSYMPYTERGLTIYTYNNNAAWVNGGILYTIEGNAPLSNEQIRRIAVSLL